MQWSDIPRNPPPRTLRQFAGLWLAFLALAACWQFWVADRTILAIVLGALALTVGPIGLAFPQLLRPVFVGWMFAVFPLSWALSLVLLAAIYYLLLTPLGLVFRLLGRDRLALKPAAAAANTYWKVKPMPSDPGSYYRQY
jgi:hypothetical protein